MFERFTEKAVNAVSEAQRFAREMKSAEVLPEHLLLALVSEAKGVSLKLFRMYNLTFDAVYNEMKETSTDGALINSVNIPFSYKVKDILKRTLD